MKKNEAGSPAPEGLQPDSMLDAALAYARSGCFIFPVYEILDDGSCACGGLDGCSPGKHPRTSNGLSAATRDEKVIRTWWEKTWPSANIGMAARPSGRAILDLDVKPGRGNGYVELETVEERYGRLPYSLRCRTGSGGLHIHLAGTSTDYSPFRSIDVRGSGYVLLPPSTHRSGNRYTWLDEDDARLEAAPAWLLRLLERPVAVIPDDADPSEVLETPGDFVEIFKQALARVAAGDSRHNTWLWLALQAHDARLKAVALTPLMEPFLAASRRPGDREIRADELQKTTAWVFSRAKRDPHPVVEKALLPELLERPVDGDARVALVRRTARILIPILDSSRFGSADLALQLLSCVNESRCRPPLTREELNRVIHGVLEQLLSRRPA